LKKPTAEAKARQKRLKKRRSRLEKRRKFYRKAYRLKFKAERISPFKRVLVPCPYVLDLSSTDEEVREQTVRFVHELHNSWRPDQHEQLVVDMRRCEYISIATALVLTAELDVLRMKYGNQVTGMDPLHDDARKPLFAVGFHKHLRFAPTETTHAYNFLGNVTVELRTGGLEEGGGENLANASASVATILSKVYDNEEYEAREASIHRAIGEGLLNVRQHAYDSSNPGAEKAAPNEERRWWALGIVLPQNNVLILVVYDRGVGIPNTLQTSLLEQAQRMMEGRTRDEARLLAALEYGRTSRIDADGNKASGGNGLPAMIDLISEYPGSQIVVESGKARYIKINASGLDGDGVSISTRSELKGTLVNWTLQLDGQEFDGNDDNERAQN